MKNLLVLPVVIFLLTGCSQTQMNDLTNSISNTLGSLISVDTGDSTNNTNSQTTSSQKTITRTPGEFILTVPQDIDTVFAAIVNEFGFPSPQILKNKHGDMADWMVKDGYYHYDLTPGAYYYLGYGYLEHKSETLALEIKLMKSGSGTKIMTEYLYGASSQTVKNELISRIKKSLK